MIPAHSFVSGFNAVAHLANIDLLTQHGRVLQAKQIDSLDTLQTILCCDFEKILHALVEVQSVSATEILTNFFIESSGFLPNIQSYIQGDRLNHVGFEICEPLDVILHDLPDYLSALSQILCKPIILGKQLRFPASEAFRQRVGASTDILCLWLEIDNHTVMLELFDIERSIHPVLPNKDRNIPAQRGSMQQHQLAMHALFENDKIWHYSVDVATRDDILQLHDIFRTLNSTHYKLAYPAPILNNYDHSFHTKIINITRHLEVEFVTRQLL